jgi:hypothetical protein
MHSNLVFFEASLQYVLYSFQRFWLCNKQTTINRVNLDGNGWLTGDNLLETQIDNDYYIEYIEARTQNTVAYIYGCDSVKFQRLCKMQGRNKNVVGSWNYNGKKHEFGFTNQKPCFFLHICMGKFPLFISTIFGFAATCIIYRVCVCLLFTNIHQYTTYTHPQPHCILLLTKCSFSPVDGEYLFRCVI